MSLILEVVSTQRRTLGDKRYLTFSRDGGTIGRSLQSDWPLPDPKRFLSGKHASIDFHSGRYYIVDTSRNGVYVNDASEPVGRGKPQRLFPGDQVRIGEYKFLVSIDDADDTRAMVQSESHIDPVNRRQRVDSPDPVTYDLVEEHVLNGTGIEMKLKDETGSSPNTQPEVAASPEPMPRARTERTDTALPRFGAATESRPQASPPARAESKTEDEESDSPLHAFFRGAGIDPANFQEERSEELMFALGQVTREMIVGMIDCLKVRSIQKAQLHQSNTTIQAEGNNPLKFCANFEDGFAQLLLNGSEQHMTPVESIQSAFCELNEHQQALLTAFREAVEQYLDRLEPEKIEGMASHGRKNALVSAANRYRYWDIYKDVYAELATRPVDEFPQAFIDTLAQAYADAIDKDASPAIAQFGS